VSVRKAGTATIVKGITMTTSQKTLITAAVAIAVGAGIYLARQASTSPAPDQPLAQEQAAPALDTGLLARERDDATNKLAALQTENERLGRNTGELLRLRGEVTRLRELQNDVAAAGQPTAQQPESSPGLAEWKPEQLTNAGRASSLDALQTLLWACASTNQAEMANCLVPDAGDPPSDEAIQSYLNDPRNSYLSGFRKFSVVSQTNLSADEAALELQMGSDGRGISTTVRLRNVYGEWKVVVFTRRDADGKAYGVHLHVDKPPPAA
jgi:hypothetical protein